MGPQTAGAVAANADSAASFVTALGNLLKYGAPGLALAVIIVCFISLHSLQRQALAGTVPLARIAPFERLQKFFLVAAIALFCISTVAPKLLEFFFDKPPVIARHTLAFNLSPTSFEREELAPRLVVSGQGERITFLNGTGRDTVDADKTYQLDVDRLVKEINDARFLALQQQLQQAAGAGGHGALANR